MSAVTLHRIRLFTTDVSRSLRCVRYECNEERKFENEGEYMSFVKGLKAMYRGKLDVVTHTSRRRSGKHR